MRKFLIIFAAIGLMAGFAGKVMATGDGASQTQVVTFNLPTITILGVENGSAPPVFTFSAPTDAGDTIAAQKDVASWINITSILSDASHHKIVTVGMGASDVVPAGTLLDLETMDHVSGGASGAWGTAVGKKNLNGVLVSSPLTIIDGIGSGYTGTGTDLGYQLKYTWRINPAFPVGLISTSATTITLTYTISEVANPI